MQRIFFSILILSLLTSCNHPINQSQGNTMLANITIQSIDFEKSFSLPGERARWTVSLFTDQAVEVVMVSTITYLDQQFAETRQEFSIGPGEWIGQLSWQPPIDSPRGYGLDIRVETPQGQILATRSSAFDVLKVWIENPRYGFLTDFSPNRSNGEQALDILKRYHLNGLQFYDWMYRHDTYLPPEDTFTDPLGRQLSLETTKKLIDAGHDRGMAAMPYTAVYAASVPFFEQHRDWGLYKASGDPTFFGENFLVIMDPRPDSPWTRHLLDQFAQILSATKFDGIHLDQYGDPKSGYSIEGEHFDLDQPLAALINSTSELVKQARGESGAVIFNAVTNWPIEAVAPSREDVVYIEVWPPYTGFNDLELLVIRAQKLGGGKPVIIAAYIDPAYETNALLNDAIIFGSGAGHIELGEHGGYLSEAYFPKYTMPSPQLSTDLQRYYEFAIRYENVIGPTAHPGGVQATRTVSVTGYETSPQLMKNKVMPIMRESDGYTAISLVNLLGLEHGEWAKELKQNPMPLQNAEVKINKVDKKAASVWFASPDREDLSLQPLDFQQDGDVLKLTLPSLEYWSLIIIHWSK